MTSLDSRGFACGLMDDYKTTVADFEIVVVDLEVVLALGLPDELRGQAEALLNELR